MSYTFPPAPDQPPTGRGFNPAQSGDITFRPAVILRPVRVIPAPSTRLSHSIAPPMVAPNSYPSHKYQYNADAPPFQPTQLQQNIRDPWAQVSGEKYQPVEALEQSTLTLEQRIIRRPITTVIPSDRRSSTPAVLSEPPAASAVTETSQLTATMAQSSPAESASSTKKTITEIIIEGATITVKNFNKNPDESYTAVCENYSLRGSFNAQGVLEGKELKINYKNGKKTTHFYEGPVTVINHQIIPQGHGRITKSDASITAEFVAGEIIGDATIRKGNREYMGPIDEYFSPICQVTLQDGRCALTGEFDSQLKLWGNGSVVYRNDEKQLLHTVFGEFKADKITQGRITMPNGDYYEGLIKDNHLPDKGMLYFNLDIQPPYQPQFPNSIQYHKCIRNADNSFSWTAHLGLFSQPVTIIGPSDSTSAIRPEGNTCKIITADRKKYIAEFEQGILIVLQDLNGNILRFIQQQEAVWIMKQPATPQVEPLDYFGKIQRDSLLPHDQQGILIKNSLTVDDVSQSIQAYGFGCFDAGNLTHLSYYLCNSTAPIPESHHLTAEQCARLKAINHQYNYVGDYLNTDQFFLAYEGSTRILKDKISAHSINEEKNHSYFWRDGKLNHCEAIFRNGFAEDDQAIFTVNDITFKGGIRSGLIRGPGNFSHQENYLEGSFITELVAVPLPIPVSMPLLPPTPSVRSRTYQPVTLTAGEISINAGTTLNGTAITETALHQLPAFEAFLPADKVLPQIVFSVNY